MGFGAKLQQIKADLTRVADVMAYKAGPQISTRDNVVVRPLVGSERLTGAIELRNVTFGYNPNEPPLIENFNLIVHPGQRVALVGGSGSGKTTIGRLICGLYPVWSGEILFDGQRITDIDPAVLANSQEQQQRLAARSASDRRSLQWALQQLAEVGGGLAPQAERVVSHDPAIGAFKRLG